MRQLPKRTPLSYVTASSLSTQTKAIEASQTPKEEAGKRYASARNSSWFKPIVEALQKLAGPGERCMYCSGGEASQVEHYYPLSRYPRRAMIWENFLWACALCNQYKGDRFPLVDDKPNILNPLDENVWSFFFIDEYGNLTAVWNASVDDVDPRARATIEILGLDRQALQESRQARLEDLKARIRDTIRLFKSGQLDKSALNERLQAWLRQPFQPDVANYFLDGPGRFETPFSEYFSLLDQ